MESALDPATPTSEDKAADRRGGIRPSLLRTGGAIAAGVLVLMLGALGIDWIKSGFCPPGCPPPCPSAPFGWNQQITTKDPRGTYSFGLTKCDTLWFNSGSVSVNGQRVGGGVISENTVVLYRVTEDRRVTVSVGNPRDVGNEWWAIGKADFEHTLLGWGNSALASPNCGTGCARLLVYEYLDGNLVGSGTTFP
jgi:hypothetical protein